MSTKEEGPRGFAVLLQQIDDGELHEELSGALHKVNRELSDYAEKFASTAKGSITVTINLSAKPNGTVDVKADVKTKTPKVSRPGSTFWLTDGCNLSAENPRQTKLPLRPVDAPKAEVRELSADAPNVRSV